eukprot:5847569-Pleurochrysis_carterae.AAC.1
MAGSAAKWREARPNGGRRGGACVVSTPTVASFRRAARSVCTSHQRFGQRFNSFKMVTGRALGSPDPAD